MKKKLRKITSLAVLALLVSVFVGAGYTSPVNALTVSPVRIEIALDPGETYEGTYRLTNENEFPRTYFSSFQNFRAEGESGTPYFVPESIGLASWMDGQEAVTLAPFESREIGYTITVPTDAEPGGYFAASFWMSSPDNVSGDSNASSVSFRVGILVLVRINGEIAENGGIVELTSDTSFTSETPVDLAYRFQNAGNDRLKPKGTIKVKNMFGRTVNEFDANPQIGNVLPESRRRFELTWFNQEKDLDNEAQGFFAKAGRQLRQRHFGLYTLKLDLTYGVDNTLSDTAKVRIFVLPYHLLIIVLAILVFLKIAFRFAKRSMKRAVDRQVERIKNTISPEDSETEETETEE